MQKKYSILKSKLAIAYLLTFILFLLLPIVLDYSNNPYWISIGVNYLIWIILGLAMNIALGYAGLFQLGQAGFYAVGAYVVAILNVKIFTFVIYGITFKIGGYSFFPSLLIALVISCIVGYLFSRPILRLRGDYLCIATIGLGEIIRYILTNDLINAPPGDYAPPMKILGTGKSLLIILDNPVGGLTGGPNGISGIARPEILGFTFDTPFKYYYLVMFFVLLVLFVMKRLENSRLGRAWTYIREDETAAQSMGVDIVHYKLLAFIISAGIAGIAGGLYAGRYTVISPAPDVFGFGASVLMFCIVVLGGIGSIPGVLVGSLGLVLLPEIFRSFPEARYLFVGIAMLLMMIFRPHGLIPGNMLSFNKKYCDACSSNT